MGKDYYRATAPLHRHREAGIPAVAIHIPKTLAQKKDFRLRIFAENPFFVTAIA